MRPLNLGETLDASIKIVMARWKTLATVMLVIALPLELANIVIISSTTDVYQAGSLLSSDATKTTYSDSGAYAAGQVAIIALTFLSYLLGNVACYRAIADTYLQRDTSARESLSFAAGRLGATLWLSILLVVGVFLGFLFLILPGFWLLIAWSVALPVLLVEGIGGFGAIGRSFKLVEGRWWATCGRFVVAYILAGVATSVVGLAFDALASGVVDDTSTGALILSRFGDLLVSLVTTPFIAAVTTLVYFDLRVRKEGFDLALLAQRMGGASAYDPAPQRDAFGNPVAPGAGSTPPPAPSSSYLPPSAAPAGAWAPPVAPGAGDTPGAPPPSQPPPPVPDE
ncbi:hypothetical protein [Conexibacter woesei]|uniref:hypothetical protein n=1 Tax=Conexibacter woesei TaxID=191495 RepID=UPI0004117611|nr:hypothetical protein [Conexibacter woesei]